VGKYVDVYDFPDDRLEVRTKGLLLPYCIFSKDQRVNLANTLERNEVEDWPVITYLTDSRQWNAVEVDLFYTACSAGEERRLGTGLSTW
jgi:hypothetical protein